MSGNKRFGKTSECVAVAAWGAFCLDLLCIKWYGMNMNEPEWNHEDAHIKSQGRTESTLCQDQLVLQMLHLMELVWQDLFLSKFWVVCGFTKTTRTSGSHKQIPGKDPTVRVCWFIDSSFEYPLSGSDRSVCPKKRTKCCALYHTETWSRFSNVEFTGCNFGHAFLSAIKLSFW